MAHTAPVLLRSLFSSVTLSKPHTPSFLALSAPPWHSPLRQHVGLGIKIDLLTFSLGLIFQPDYGWFLQQDFFFPLVFSFCPPSDGQQWGGGQGCSLLAGTSGRSQRGSPGFGNADVPPCPAQGYWGLLVSVQTGFLYAGGTAQSCVSIDCCHQSLALQDLSQWEGREHPPSSAVQSILSAALGASAVLVAELREGERGNASRSERADPPLVTRSGNHSQAAGDQPPPAAPAAKTQFAQVHLSLALWP